MPCEGLPLHPALSVPYLAVTSPTFQSTLINHYNGSYQSASKELCGCSLQSETVENYDRPQKGRQSESVVFIACAGDTPVGTVRLRIPHAIEEVGREFDVEESKRVAEREFTKRSVGQVGLVESLYVRQTWRGSTASFDLAQAVIDECRAEEMVDTRGGNAPYTHYIRRCRG